MPARHNTKQMKKSHGTVALYRTMTSQSSVVKQLLTGYVSLVSTGSNGTVTPISYVSSCGGWAGYAADYNNFRVLAARCQYVPYYGRSATNGAGIGVVCVYNGGLASTTPSAPASQAAITDQHDDYRFVSPGKHFQLDWSPVGLVQKQLTTTATPATIAPFGGFLFRFENCATATLGQFYFQFVVEFTRA
jgi:hypothetical protein